MKIKGLVDEDFVNYKKPSMFIGTISCSGKCCIEAGIPLSVCQNDGWRSCAPVSIDNNKLCERYLNNPLTQAIVFGGLEPFEQYYELMEFLNILRNHYACNDDVVIYTGYYPKEIQKELRVIGEYPNIIIKFGRFIPNSTSRFDEVLGVNLASDNQCAVKIS